jgi:hypothetical protein
MSWPEGGFVAQGLRKSGPAPWLAQPFVSEFAHMVSRLFPKQIDNDYRGWWLAIWLLAPVVLMKLAMGLNVAGFNPWISNRMVAERADGIPLDSFGVEAASTVMFMFASWGLMLLLVNLLALLALIRYRAMVPLIFLLLTLEQVGRKVIGTMSPIVREAAEKTDGISAAVLINWGFLIVLAVGLVLSLIPRQTAASD